MVLEKFENLHKGKRAFLVAGGPSLKDTDITLLDDEIVFSVSLTYKKEDLKTNYHFIGDFNIAKQFFEEIERIKCDGLFVSNGIYSICILNHPRLYSFLGHSKKEFCKNPYNGVHGGGTSTFVAMQFAYFMGIQELYVVGLDHYLTLDKQLEQVEKTGVRKNKHDLVETVGEDVNHFTKDYYPKGVKWFVPQVKRMAESYSLARKAFEEDGRRVYNASLVTGLSEEILPRIEYDEYKSPFWCESCAGLGYIPIDGNAWPDPCQDCLAPGRWSVE